MAIPATHCEAKKHAYRQTQDGIVVSFVLHPNEVPEDLALAPLGTRYMLALVRIGDDEEPLPPEKPKRPSERWEDMPRVKRAGILCSDETFQKWAYEQAEKQGCGKHPWTSGHVIGKTGARQFVLDECGVDRRRDLDNSLASRTAFDMMVTRYREETRRVTEVR